MLAVLLSAFLLIGQRGSGTGTGSGSGSASGSCDLAGLPPQVSTTLREIHSGGPFPFRADGEVFDNREGRLPGEPRGWYHAYTVVTPGSDDRGERRLVAGGGASAVAPDVVYYTGNHYVSFCLIRGAG